MSAQWRPIFVITDVALIPQGLSTVNVWVVGVDTDVRTKSRWHLTLVTHLLACMIINVQVQMVVTIVIVTAGSFPRIAKIGMNAQSQTYATMAFA